MSYVVLARKYRPKTFEEIVGQKHIAKTLVNTIKMKRIGHAYLFSGPRGVGKTSTARILAKAINCEKGINPISCNECSNCKEIAEGRSIDVLEIDGASNRGIDEIRQLRENIKFTTINSRYKIYIIDEVHMLTTEAFNALLKTLEEPPSHIIFILATTQSYKVPLTILSRCQHFAFRRILDKDMIQRLKFIAQEEKLKITEDALSLIAISSEGSIRDAQGILDQSISFCEGEITLKDVSSILGSVEHKILFDLTNMLIKKDIKEAFDLIDNIINQGFDITQFIKDLKRHFRNLLFINVIEDPSKFLELKMFTNEFKEQSSKFITETLVKMIYFLSDLELQLKQSSYPKILLELAIIELSNLIKFPSSQEILQRIVKLEEKINNKEVSSNISLESNHKETIALEIEPSINEKNSLLINNWEKIISNITAKNRMLGAFLIVGKPLRIEKDVVIIGFNKEFLYNKEQIEKINNRKIIEQEINEIIKSNFKIKCEFGEIKQEKLHFSNVNSGEKHILEKEPIIKKAIEFFDGKIIKE